MAKKTTKKSLRERILEKKKKLAERGSGGNYILRQKEEGTIRVRVLPTGDDFTYEIISFYLDGIGGVNSPATFGEPCALMELYNELKNSDDEVDKSLAKKVTPRTKMVTPIIMYKDLKGKEVDEENSGRLLQITNSVSQELIDLYLDDDEWGDMTDPINGYDIKITRTGKTLTDTSYTVSPCKNTKAPSKYRKQVVDLEEMVKAQIDSYEKTLEIREKFLGNSEEEDDEEYVPKGKSKKKKGTKTKDVKKTSSKGTKKKKSKDI